jgi:RNA polymerase sigma-70 factor, ECF subfamily
VLDLARAPARARPRPIGFGTEICLDLLERAVFGLGNDRHEEDDRADPEDAAAGSRWCVFAHMLAARHRPPQALYAMERQLDPARLGDHLDRLYRAAWALCGSREDAEDLVQETFARLLARPRLLRREDDLGYLLRALRNTFINQKRIERRRLRAAPLPDQLDLVADPHALQPDAALEASELYVAVAGLSDDFRDVLVAVDVAGLSYKEAARALRIREGTVMSRLYRARQQVVRRLEGEPA